MKGLRSLNDRLQALEEKREEAESRPPNLKRLNSLVTRSELVKRHTLEAELDKLSRHFNEKVAGISNVFGIVAETLRYVEVNCHKMSLLLSIPITSEFKLQTAISLLNDIQSVELDESLLTELVSFLVPLLFPKLNKADDLGDVFDSPVMKKSTSSQNLHTPKKGWFNRKKG